MLLFVDGLSISVVGWSLIVVDVCDIVCASVMLIASMLFAVVGVRYCVLCRCWVFVVLAWCCVVLRGAVMLRAV